MHLFCKLLLVLEFSRSVAKASDLSSVLKAVGLSTVPNTDAGGWESLWVQTVNNGIGKTCNLNYVSQNQAGDKLKNSLRAEEKDKQVEPFVLAGLADDWPALRTWKNREHFLAEHGNLTLSVGDHAAIQSFGGFDYAYKKVSIADFASSPSARGHVAFTSGIQRNYEFKRLLDDTRVPSELDGFSEEFVLSFGHHGTGLSPHVHGDSWLTLVVGTKLWFFQPPAWVPWAPRFSEFMDLFSNGGMPSHTTMCLQLPGETIFVPSGWGHATVNLGFTLAVGKQAYPGMVRRKDFNLNPKNPHTLLRAAMAVSEMKNSEKHFFKHIETILSDDPVNVEALYLKVFQTLSSEKRTEKQKNKVCNTVRKRLQRWLEENDQADELASVGLRAINEQCGHGHDPEL